MARVFVQRIVRSPHGHRNGPRLRERRRIIDRELVRHRVGVDPREPLDQMHVRPNQRDPIVGVSEAPSSVVGLVGEVRRLDHQCVAFPVAPRVAEPLPNRRRGMRAIVQGHDPCLMNHLVEQYDVAWRLKHLNATVVVKQAGNHWRSGCTSHEAALE